jgi:hypothetical protein
MYRLVGLGAGLALLLVLVLGNGLTAQTGQPVQPAAARQPKAGATAGSAVPAPALAESLQRFDPRDVRVQWNNRHWQLVHRGTVLKDFGFREQDARQAARLLLDLKLNEHGTIGSPQPVMEYWLSDGKAPQALALAGARMLPLDQAHLRVEQVNGQWCIGDGPRVLYTFGQQADEARQALAVMRKYHFSQAAVLGQGGPSMVVFLASSRAEAPTMPVAGRTASGRQIQVNRFPRLAKDANGKPHREAPNPANSPLAGVVSPVLPAATGSARQVPVAAASPVSPAQAGPQSPVTAVAALDRVPFDWRQVQLRQGATGEWKLAAGGLVLAEFGSNVQEARLALSALRYYRFREQWRMGSGPAARAWYVAGATSPRGLMMGLSGQAFQPDKLQVQKVDERFVLCNGQQVVLRLGERREVAAQALETIKRNHVDRLCQVGDPGKTPITILVRSR